MLAGSELTVSYERGSFEYKCGTAAPRSNDLCEADLDEAFQAFCDVVGADKLALAMVFGGADGSNMSSQASSLSGSQEENALTEEILARNRAFFN